MNMWSTILGFVRMCLGLNNGSWQNRLYLDDQFVRETAEFDDGCARIIAQAKHEACRFNHEAIGIEHLILGIVDCDHLKNCGDSSSSLSTARAKVLAVVGDGPDRVTIRPMSATPAAVGAFRGAAALAFRDGSSSVRPKHLCRATLGCQDEAAIAILSAIGIDVGKTGPSFFSDSDK